MFQKVISVFGVPFESESLKIDFSSKKVEGIMSKDEKFYPPYPKRGVYVNVAKGTVAKVAIEPSEGFHVPLILYSFSDGQSFGFQMEEDRFMSILDKAGLVG